MGLFHGGTKMNRGNVRLSKHMTDEGRQMGEEGVLATRPTHSCSKKSLGEGNPSPPNNKTKPNPKPPTLLKKGKPDNFLFLLL